MCSHERLWRAACLLLAVRRAEEIGQDIQSVQDGRN